MRNVLLAAMATMGLVGCVGGINDMGTGDDTNPPPTSRTARQMFDQDVYTVLKADCGGCHTATATPLTDKTYFVGATADIGYDTATKYTALVSDFSPSDAPILTKIAAGHNNLTYTTDQLGKITTWLNQEVSERTQGAVPPPSPPGTPPPTTESAAQTQARLDGSRDGMVSNMGGTFKSEAKIELNGKYPGREILADIPSKGGAVRVFGKPVLIVLMIKRLPVKQHHQVRVLLDRAAFAQVGHARPVVLALLGHAVELG